jgi:hypothetical protein
MTMEKMIRMPPMVGVPFLERCVSGPSFLMGWPICRDWSFLISQGPMIKQINKAVTVA